MRDARRIKNYNAANFMKAKTVIVGSGWSGRTIASILLQRQGYELLGFVDDGNQDSQVTVPCKDGDHRYPRLGDMRALMKIIDDYKVRFTFPEPDGLALVKLRWFVFGAGWSMGPADR